MIKEMKYANYKFAFSFDIAKDAMPNGLRREIYTLRQTKVVNTIRFQLKRSQEKTPVTETNSIDKQEIVRLRSLTNPQ